MLQLMDGTRTVPLFDVATTRLIEQHALARLPPGSLMQRAGRATARLALALAPHARRIVIACGPGNNGGDGLDAAARLQASGKDVLIIHQARADHLPPDARAALQRARAAGATFASALPDDLGAQDLCIDALLGIGASRPPAGVMARLLEGLHDSPAPLLCVDVASGLDADTGQLLQGNASHRRGKRCHAPVHTLTLLTCKPGLFTASGRDASGQIWYDDLDTTADAPLAPAAWLTPRPAMARRPHASHKGSWGDVAVLGGAHDSGSGNAMLGAALLAATAALHAGAGRVHLSLLDEHPPALIAPQPELMLRKPASLPLPALTMVCGCGAGDAIAPLLGRVLAEARQLVLDADGLNAVADDPALQRQLAARHGRAQPTVLTPHPLEAARLLGLTTAAVQADRLAAAREMAGRYRCTVALKGSGTIIASPGQASHINPTGNARLACAGTGDVLAGFVGACLARGLPAQEAACTAVYRHGALADAWPARQPLTALALARRWPAPDVA